MVNKKLLLELQYATIGLVGILVIPFSIDWFFTNLPDWIAWTAIIILCKGLLIFYIGIAYVERKKQT